MHDHGEKDNDRPNADLGHSLLRRVCLSPAPPRPLPIRVWKGREGLSRRAELGAPELPLYPQLTQEAASSEEGGMRREKFLSPPSPISIDIHVIGCKMDPFSRYQL
jgi:hypothetical protein